MSLANSLYIQRFDRFLKFVFNKYKYEASNGRMLGDHLQQLVQCTRLLLTLEYDLYILVLDKVLAKPNIKCCFCVEA